MKAILTYEGVDFQIFYDVQQPENEIGFRGAVDISGIYIVEHAGHIRTTC